MFFPEKIKSVQKDDFVLEIGPGATPHPRSDIFLDIKFDSDEERIIQLGYDGRLDSQKPFVYYDGLNFPFKDKKFDYVICSHVLEHISIENVSLFISEIERISDKGYIEAPSVFYDYIFNHKAHKLLIFSRNNVLQILDKNRLNLGSINDFFWLLQKYGDSKSTNLFIRVNKELFFWGFEWHDYIKHNIVNNIDSLLCQSDLQEFMDKLLLKSQKNIKKNNYVYGLLKCLSIFKIYWFKR